MSELMHAVQKLRDSVVALPEPIQAPWKAYNEMVYVDCNGTDHVFAWTDVNRTTSPAGNAETATHMALASNPSTVLAMAELLYMIQCHMDFTVPFEAIEEAAEYLASLLNGEADPYPLVKVTCGAEAYGHRCTLDQHGPETWHSADIMTSGGAKRFVWLDDPERERAMARDVAYGNCCGECGPGLCGADAANGEQFTGR